MVFSVPELRDLIHDHNWKQIKDIPCLKNFMDYLRTKAPPGTEPNIQSFVRKQVASYLDRKRRDAQTERFRLAVGGATTDLASVKEKGKRKRTGL